METDGDTTPASSPRQSGRSTWPRRFLPILIPLLVIAAGWQIRDIWTARSIGGVYVLPDGASYVVLKRGVVPAVRTPEGFIWTDRGQSGAPLRVANLRAILLGNELILRQKLASDISRGTDGTAKLRDSLTLHLRPSKSVPGDWDLVSANLNKKANSLYSDFPVSVNGQFPGLLGLEDPNASFGSSLNRRIMRGKYEWLRTYFTCVRDRADAPIPSFLHRVKDPRVARYFNNQLNGVDSKEDLEALREMDRRDSPDIYLALHHLALEARIGNVENAERIWERWSAAHGRQAHETTRRTAEKAHRILLNAQWRRKYPELVRQRDSWESVFSKSRDAGPGRSTPQEPEKRFDAYLAFLRNASRTDSPYFPVERLVPPSLKSPDDSPYFLPVQILTKVAWVEAVLALLRGDRTRSLETLAGCYWTGESLNGGGVFIERLIGIAVRTIATTGLEMHALNGCETAEDLKAAWDMLEHLANLPGQETDSSPRALVDTPIVGEMRFSGPYAPNFRESEIRQKVGDVRFAILRTAVAARYHLLTAGAFPKSSAEFGPLLPRGPLSDCFATSAPLRFLDKPDGFHVYSVGPDKRDDVAAIFYDASNGSVSQGNISLRIPRGREYPFPSGGVRVNTAAELLRLFPNGLPPDPFADKRGRPLSIIAPSGADVPTSSVVVFSFGPDTDESEHLSFRHLTGEDVFTTYSVPTARHQLVFAPNAPSAPPASPQAGTLPGANTGMRVPAGRMYPGMMGYGLSRVGYPSLNPAAYPLWQPVYDPTNGTTSKGNLYLRIPPP